MNYKIINNKGITLIELIIVLTLISVLLMISYNLFFSGWTNYNRQVDNVDNQIKAKQVIRDISTELRKADAKDITIDPDGEAIEISGIKYKFDLDSKSLTRNDKEYVVGIEEFKVVQEDNKLTIKITTLPNKGDEITITSKVHIRE